MRTIEQKQVMQIGRLEQLGLVDNVNNTSRDNRAMNHSQPKVSLNGTKLLDQMQPHRDLAHHFAKKNQDLWQKQ